jgi:hypothetical protein
MMDPRGNSKEIQDAWMALLQPDRDKARAAQEQRLANQGIFANSDPYHSSMLQQDEADTDAQNKALIAGTAEYGNQFNRSLQNRQQGLGEYQYGYNEPLKTYQGLMGIPQQETRFGNYAQSPGANPADIYGASKDQYTQAQNQANATNASRNNLTQGLFGLSGGFWGGK